MNVLRRLTKKRCKLVQSIAKSSNSKNSVAVSKRIEFKVKHFQFQAMEFFGPVWLSVRCCCWLKLIVIGNWCHHVRLLLVLVFFASFSALFFLSYVFENYCTIQLYYYVFYLLFLNLSFANGMLLQMFCCNFSFCLDLHGF